MQLSKFGLSHYKVDLHCNFQWFDRMRTFYTAVLLSISIFASTSESHACTTFCIKDSNHLVFGKNYDFYTGVGMLIVNKRNLSKTAYEIPPEKPVDWVSKYGSVTFNQMGKDFPMGGMNEKGLVIEIMWLDDTRYPEVDNRHGLTELQWIQYQLDNSASVEDIIASDKTLRISKLSSAPVHFLVCDSKGNAATIEYIDGKMVYHTKETLPVCVLTNDTYQRSHHNLKSIRDLKSHPFTSGSFDRFAKAASMVQEYDGQNVIEYSFSILDAVKQRNFTRWSIVYDIRNMVIHYKTENNEQARVVKVSGLNFDCNMKSEFVDIDSPVKDVKSSFRILNYEDNLRLIEKAFGGVDFLQDISADERKRIARYPESARCEK